MALTTEEEATLKDVAKEKKLEKAIESVVETAEAAMKVKRDEISAIAAKRDADIAALRNA